MAMAMDYTNVIDESNGHWHYDISEAMLPRGERPFYVTIRAWDDRWEDAWTRTITNRDLCGLFDDEGGQICGTSQFELPRTPEGMIGSLRKKLEGAVRLAADRAAQKYDGAKYEEMQRAASQMMDRAGSDFDCGKIFWWGDYQKELGHIQAKLEEGILRLAERASSGQ